MPHMALHDIASSLSRDKLTRWAAGSTMLAVHDKTIVSNKVTARGCQRRKWAGAGPGAGEKRGFHPVRERVLGPVS